MSFQTEDEWGFFIDLELDNLLYTYPQQENIYQHESQVNYKTVINIYPSQEYDYEFDYPSQPNTTTFINVNNRKKSEHNHFIINILLSGIIVYVFNVVNALFN